MLKMSHVAVMLSLVFAMPAFSKEGAASIKDCEKKNFEACTIAGSHHQWGTGGLKQDANLSIQYYQKACEGKSAGGCFGMALIYDDPTYPRKDPAKAAEFYKKACDLRHEYACLALEAKKKGK